MTNARVCVIDDDEVIRDSMVDLFESRGVRISTYSQAERFVSIWKTSELREVPALFIMDIRMPGMSGIEAFRHMLDFGLPSYNLVTFLSGHGELSMAVNLVKEGAFDFFEKPFSDNSLVDRVLQGLSKAEEAYNRQQASVRYKSLLSSREAEVAQLILDGFANREIAEKLSISSRTVELHRARVFEKLNVRNTVEFVKSIVERRSLDD